MGVAIAIGLFSGLGSVAMVPTHVWDAVPGDVVSSVVLAAAAATAAGVKINGYVSERPESEDDPMIIHAGGWHWQGGQHGPADPADHWSF